MDPIGLAEAEKSLKSPVQIDLAGLPLSTTLRLTLHQLGSTKTFKIPADCKVLAKDGKAGSLNINLIGVFALAELLD